MMIRISAIRKDTSDKEKEKDKEAGQEKEEQKDPLFVYNALPESSVPTGRLRHQGREWDENRELPEGFHPTLDRMCFELEGYRYDKESSEMIIYTPFEYRLHCPCGEEEYLQFAEEVDMAMAHNTNYTCKMLAYYSDPDFSTFRSLNPLLNICLRWFFH